MILRIFEFTSNYFSRIGREGGVIFIYSTCNKITSFSWKLNRYSYGVQFGINCTALDQSKLCNFVECAIRVIYLHTYDTFKVIHVMKTSLYTQHVTNFDLAYVNQLLLKIVTTSHVMR